MITKTAITKQNNKKSWVHFAVLEKEIGSKYYPEYPLHDLSKALVRLMTSFLLCSLQGVSHGENHRFSSRAKRDSHLSTQFTCQSQFLIYHPLIQS